MGEDNKKTNEGFIVDLMVTIEESGQMMIENEEKINGEIKESTQLRAQY